jgi:molybdate transport system substrate-binding protein
LTALAGCGSATGTAANESITVFAAASLAAPFTEIAANFEAANPHTEVLLNFAGSSDLLTQLSQGAPADVFAAADEHTMNTADATSLVASATVFASNTLTIVVPAGNPAGVAEFADLAGEDVATVVCAPQVPCGAATASLESATGVALSPVSEESSVTDVLGKVRSGQADAGIVYETDAAGAGDSVENIAVPEAATVINRYPIAALAEAANEEAADAFVNFVLSESGQRTLADAGFGAP